MNDERKSFVFYKSFYEAITDKDVCLNRNEQLDLFIAIAEYCLFGVVPELKGRCKAMWILIKPQLDANNKKYENGKKGGAPKGNTNAKKQPKTTKNNLKQPNVNVNVNGNENGKIQPAVETMPEYVRERIKNIV